MEGRSTTGAMWEQIGATVLEIFFIENGEKISLWEEKLQETWKMSSSGMWRCVDPWLIDISKERIASIFRVENPRAGNQRH
jgi:hypothetical protein